jgi:hypothetical protein
MEHVVLGGHEYPERFELVDSRFGRSWSTATVAERKVLFEEIQPLFKNAEPKCRKDWLEQLRRWAHADEVDCEAHRAMTVEELQQLARSQWVTIGAHSVTHSSLSSLTGEDQQKEILDSKRQLEAWLEQEITVFSYPFGTRADYTSETVQFCREARFAKAASNFPAQVHSWTDPYQIPRYFVRNWPVEDFARRLKGFWFS